MQRRPDNLITLEPRLLRFARPGAEGPSGVEGMDLEALQKALMTRYVLPVMSIMATLFFACYVTLERQKLLVFAFYLLVTGANAYLSSANRRLRLGPVELWSRSDAFDAARWLFNLVVADAAIAVVLHPSGPAFVGAWTILVLSAQADMYRRRFRVPVVAAGLVTAAVLLRKLYPTLSLAEDILVLFCIGGASTMLGMAETYWLRELAQHHEARRRETAARYEARQLKQEALIGTHVRTVAHELGNLLSVLDLASSLHEEGISGNELVMIRRSVDYAKRLNALLLRDVRSTETMRTMSVAELVEDVELLLGKEVVRRGLKWSVTVDPEVAGARFRERAGSVYFIVHNLVKNAWEAKAPQISLEIAAAGRGIVLAVCDDAGGMPDAQREAILAGQAESTKDGGHGLGLRFVVDECRRNEFSISIETAPGRGTCFRLVIPQD